MSRLLLSLDGSVSRDDRDAPSQDGVCARRVMRSWVRHAAPFVRRLRVEHVCDGMWLSPTCGVA